MKCAFCGAPPKDGWDGFDLNWFQCGTMYKYDHPDYTDQTPQCEAAEKEVKP